MEIRCKYRWLALEFEGDFGGHSEPMQYPASSPRGSQVWTENDHRTPCISPANLDNTVFLGSDNRTLSEVSIVYCVIYDGYAIR